MTEHPTDALLDLTKNVAEQSNAELAATLKMHSGWQCLREIGEGSDIRAAQIEAAKRLEAAKPSTPIDEKMVVQSVIEELEYIAGDETTKLVAAQAVKRAIALLKATNSERRMNAPCRLCGEVEVLANCATECPERMATPIDDEGLVEKLRKALKVADEALRNHACHGGEKSPCLRSHYQCSIECGKAAGDALLIVEKALSNVS